MVNANLSEHEPKWFTKMFKGPFYDYMPEWYMDVGLKLILTMAVQAIMPFVNIV